MHGTLTTLCPQCSSCEGTQSQRNFKLFSRVKICILFFSEPSLPTFLYYFCTVLLSFSFDTLQIMSSILFSISPTFMNLCCFCLSTPTFTNWSFFDWNFFSLHYFSFFQVSQFISFLSTVKRHKEKPKIFRAKKKSWLHKVLPVNKPNPNLMNFMSLNGPISHHWCENQLTDSSWTSYISE